MNSHTQQLEKDNPIFSDADRDLLDNEFARYLADNAVGSGLDFLNPILLTAAGSLEVGKTHSVTGSGFALELPDPVLGSRIFLEISAAATGLYPLTDTSYTLQGGESAMLLATASGWIRTSGEKVATSIRVATNPATELIAAENTDALVPYTQLVRSQGVVDFAGNKVTIRRAASATVDASFVLSNVSTTGYYQAAIRQKRGSLEMILAIALVPVQNVFAMEAISCKAQVLPGDEIYSTLYVIGGAKYRQEADQPNTLTYTED